MTDFKLRNYGEELSIIFQRKSLTDEDVNEIVLLVKEIVDEQLNLGFKANEISGDNEEILKKGIKKLTLDEIKYYISLFKECGFNNIFILKFIWQIIHATRNIG